VPGPAVSLRTYGEALECGSWGNRLAVAAIMLAGRLRGIEIPERPGLRRWLATHNERELSDSCLDCGEADASIPDLIHRLTELAQRHRRKRYRSTRLRPRLTLTPDCCARMDQRRYGMVSPLCHLPPAGIDL